MLCGLATCLLQCHAAARRFEWVDGALTKAIEAGQWVLLENANLCSATVLDRLNPLLEPDGALLLNECGTSSGQPRILRPHPNFRLILAQDPRCASRRMPHTSVWQHPRALMGAPRRRHVLVQIDLIWYTA